MTHDDDSLSSFPRDRHSQAAYVAAPGQPEKSTSGPKLIALSLLGAVAIGGTLFLLNSSDDKQTDELTTSTSDIPITSYTNDTLAPTSLRETEVGYGEAILADMRQSTVSELRAGGFTFPDPEYSEHASNRGLAASVLVDLYSVSKIGAKNKAEGERVLASIIKPATNNYDRAAAMIGPGTKGIVANTIDVRDWTQNFSISNYKDIVTSNGSPMRVMTTTQQGVPNSIGISDTNQIIFQRENAILPDGSRTQRWVIQEIISPHDPRYEEDLQIINAQVK